MKINIEYLKQIWHFIVKYKSIITITAFVIWIAVLDSDSYYYQWKNNRKLEELEQQIREMEKTIKELKEKSDFSASETVEKYAREILFMKKEDEDIFIVDSI